MPVSSKSKKSVGLKVKRTTRAFYSRVTTEAAVEKSVVADAPYVDEDHPTGPFVHRGSRVLICGTFPPVKKSIKFYYPNSNNDMWRILGEVFFREKEHFYADVETVKVNRRNGARSVRVARGLDEAKIRDFAQSYPVGFFDVCKRIRRHRGNSSDDNIEALERTDVLHDVLTHTPHCEAIVTTGTLALTMLLDALHGCGSFTSASGDAVTPVGLNKLGKVKYSLPPVGGKLLWTPDAKASFHLQNALWIYRAPSTSRALPLRVEVKIAHYRAMFTAHLGLE